MHEQNPQEQQLAEPKVEISNYFDFLVLNRSQELADKLPEYISFGDHITHTQNVMKRYIDITGQKIERIIESEQHVLSRMRTLISTATATSSYLNMVEEFGDTLTPTEILDFFKVCLDYSDRETQLGMHSNKEDLTRKNLISLKSRDYSEKIRLAETLSIDPPKWFKGKPKEWPKFITRYGAFSSYGSPEVIYKRFTRSGDEAHIYKGNHWKKGTFKEYRPDWLNNADEQFPDLEEVKKEYAEDEQEYKALEDLNKHYYQNRVQLATVQEERWISSASFFENRRRKLEANNHDILTTLLYLNATKTTREYTMFPSVPGIEGLEEMQQSSLPELKSQERVIREFVDKNAFSKDTLSLWFEDKIREAKLSINKDSINGIITFLLTDPTDADLYQLKDQNKNYYKLLKFSLNPFFKFLSDDEKEFIREFSEVSTSPFESLQMISEIISQQYKTAPEQIPSNLVDDIKKFTTLWLMRNSDGTVFNKVENIIDKASQFVFVDNPENDLELETIQQEIKTGEDELKSASLPTWNVFLLRDHDASKKEVLKGANLDDFTADLDQQFHNSGDSFSIKTSSIINALDWFLGVPSNIRALWMKQVINDVEYYKIKRGAVRIFCSINPDTRELSFFTYQKKSMEYHFRT